MKKLHCLRKDLDTEPRGEDTQDVTIVIQGTADVKRRSKWSKLVETKTVRWEKTIGPFFSGRREKSFEKINMKCFDRRYCRGFFLN